MATITALPEYSIISGFKGSIDYYEWMGIPVVRSWPRSPGKKRTPPVEAQWPAFAYAAREWKNLSQTVRDAYMQMAQASGMDGRDLQERAYLTGIYRYPLP